MLFSTAWRPAMLAGLALIPAVTLAGTPASAQTADSGVEVHTLGVRFGDLDLSTAKGRARLDGRLRHAAAMVCIPGHGMDPLLSETVDGRCYRAALDGARHKLAQVQQDQQLVSR